MTSRAIVLVWLGLGALCVARAQGFHVEFDESSASAHVVTGSILRAADDGYFLEFPRWDTLPTPRELQVIRLDCNAQVTWSRTYAVNDPHELGLLNSQLLVDHFGDLLLSASELSTGTPYVPVLVKLDPLGNVLWCRSRVESAEVTNVASGDDGYYVSQALQGGGGMGASGMISKLGFDGATIWSKQMYNGYDRFGRAIVLSSGDLVVSGFSQLHDTLPGFTLTRMHPDGSVVWSSLYAIEIEVIDMVEDHDGNLVLGGTGYGNDDWGNGLTEMTIVKVNSNGDLVWARGYGGSNYDEGFTIHVGHHNSYVLCGEPESYSSNSQASLISTSSDGDLQWMKLYGDTALGSFPFGAVQNVDSGYTIFGINASYWGFAPLYLTRTDADGASCGQVLDTLPGSYPLFFPRVPLEPMHDATPFLPSSIIPGILAVNVATVCSTSLGPCNIGLHENAPAKTLPGVVELGDGGVSLQLPSSFEDGESEVMIFSIDGRLVYRTSTRGVQLIMGPGDLRAGPGLYLYRILSARGNSMAGAFELTR